MEVVGLALNSYKVLLYSLKIMVFRSGIALLSGTLSYKRLTES